MPALVLGTVQFGLNYGINNKTGKISKQESEKILRTAWQNGITELDSAQAYGDSEQAISATLSNFSNNFIVHSKFTLEEGSLGIKKHLSNSLVSLNKDRIGYFFFHKFSDFISTDAIDADEQEFINKTSLGLGVSVYNEEELELCLKKDFVRAIQLPYNVFDKSSEKDLLIKKAHQKGIKVYCRSVFLQGLIFMKLDELPAKLKPLSKVLGEFNAISDEFKISKMSMALGFLKNIAEVDGVLIGVDSESQLLSNLQGWNEQLPGEVLKALRELHCNEKHLLKPVNWT